MIRIGRASVLRLAGKPDVPSSPEPARWVTIRRAAEHYPVSPPLIRDLIAHEELDARRVGSGKQFRLDRSSLLALGCYHHWGDLVIGGVRPPRFVGHTLGTTACAIQINLGMPLACRSAGAN
jgi:hypothetical protein